MIELWHFHPKIELRSNCSLCWNSKNCYMKVVASLKPGERSINESVNWKPNSSIINAAADKRMECGRSILSLKKKGFLNRSAPISLVVGKVRKGDGPMGGGMGGMRMGM